MSATYSNRPIDTPSARSAGRPTDLATRAHLGAASLVIAGILFVLYPAIRPFSSETGLEGAKAFGSSSWILAHMLAMIGFALVALGLLGWYTALLRSSVERLAFWSLVVSLIGITLALPFYGGEAYGLHAIGREALRQQNGALIDLSETVRGGAGLVLFLVGLLAIGVGALMVAVTVWKASTVSRWSGMLFALAFALYIPQFFGNQPLRVAHGVLLAVGCLWLAIGTWRRADGAPVR
jgi:hypothetical protein